MPPRGRVDSSTSEPRRPPSARDDGARPRLARLDSDAGGASRDAEPPVTAAVVVRETMLGVVICFAQIPESIAFALMAHVRPPVALHSAWIVGLICGLFGGRPGMVNGATGAFAAVIATFLPAPSAPGAGSPFASKSAVQSSAVLNSAPSIVTFAQPAVVRSDRPALTHTYY